VRAFLADKGADKRNKKIDEVLARPGYAEIWAAKFSDLIKPVEGGNDGSNNLAGGEGSCCASASTNGCGPACRTIFPMTSWWSGSSSPAALKAAPSSSGSPN